MNQPPRHTLEHVPPLPLEPPPTTRRLLADPRHGVDRRAGRRREALQPVSSERRQRPDRRLGPERRSTLERRGGPHVTRSAESPGEHLRNALQLLTHVNETRDLSADDRADLAAVWERLRRALRLLEGRTDQV